MTARNGHQERRDVIEALTLHMNKVRQAAITKEKLSRLSAALLTALGESSMAEKIRRPWGVSYRSSTRHGHFNSRPGTPGDL